MVGTIAELGMGNLRVVRAYPTQARYHGAMHFDAHQPVIDDLEARILTIRDSL
jgi:hypothetical protein